MPDQLSKLLMDDSFVRFLKGEATEEEEIRWSSWIEQDRTRDQIVKKGRILLEEGTQTLPKPDSETELKRLKRRIGSDRQFTSFMDVRRRPKKLVWASMAAAASILLLVGFLARHTLLQNDGTEDSRASSINYRMVETEAGQKSTVQYSDGSKVVVNANSQMRLPDRASDTDTMQVWLEGEAFFSITRNEDADSRTFIVHTPDGDVSVLGTKFAVNTTDEQSRVVLAEGSVRVNVRDTIKNNQLNYTLKPGEMALFSPSVDNIQVEEVNTEVYTSWASDTLVMDNTPLADLIERIEFTYGVQVEVEDRALLDEKLTGKFENVNLEFLLEGLAETLDAKITRRNNTVFIQD